MKVLYLNHVGILAGSSRSLLGILKSISNSEFEKFVITPKGGFSEELKKLRIPFINALGIPQFCNTEYGYYRKFRWLILLREIFLIHHAKLWLTQ